MSYNAEDSLSKQRNSPGQECSGWEPLVPLPTALTFIGKKSSLCLFPVNQDKAVVFFFFNLIKKIYLAALSLSCSTFVGKVGPQLAHGLSSCGSLAPEYVDSAVVVGGLTYPVAHQISVFQPGVEPAPPVLEAQNLNHWTTREVPVVFFYTLPFLAPVSFHMGEMDKRAKPSLRCEVC